MTLRSRLWNKKLKDITPDELREFLIYFGFMNKEEHLVFKLVPIKKKRAK